MTLTGLGHRPVYLPPEATNHYNHTHSFGVIATQIIHTVTPIKTKKELLALSEQIPDVLSEAIQSCLSVDKNSRPKATDLVQLFMSSAINL